MFMMFLLFSSIFFSHLRLLSSSFLAFVDSEKMQKHFESPTSSRRFGVLRPLRRLRLLLQRVDPGAFSFSSR